MKALPQMARKAYKYRIFPTKGQQRVLNQLLEECRWLYVRRESRAV